MKIGRVFSRILEEFKSRSLQGMIFYLMKRIERKLLRTSYPGTLFIEITSKCNLNFSICWWQKVEAKRERHWMTFQDLKK